MANGKMEKQAQALLEKLDRPKEKKNKRPYLIEITGPPSSGKTTIIGILDSFFRRQDFRVYRPQEGAEVVRHIPRDTHLYNVRTGLYGLTLLIDASMNQNYDLVIFDRCIFDAYCWMDYWEDKKNITPEQKDILQSFFLFPTWTDLLDAIFFVMVSSKEAVRRNEIVSLTEKQGGTTNRENVEKLNRIFNNAYALTDRKENKFFVDTTKLKIKEMALSVLSLALEAMAKRT